MKRILFAIILPLLIGSLSHYRVFAADDAASKDKDLYEVQNPFSDYVPFQDEKDIDEAERFMYFGRSFAISLGTGMHVFGGNIGRLYNTAIPVVDFRIIHFFDFRLAGQFGINSASHAFSAAPNGYVEVNLFRLNFDLKYYFDLKESSAWITAANPYIVCGIGQTFRTQVMQTLNFVNKDTAFAVSAGAGLEFYIKPRKTSLSFEGRIHQMFFKDRFDQIYLPSGVKDTTGPMYSLLTSVIFYF